MIKEQFVAYEPGTETRLGLLPQPQTSSIAYVHNNVGALQMEYSSLSAGGPLIARRLETGLDIAVEWNVLGGPNDWFEPFNSRFLLIKRTGDLADPAKIANLTCPSYGWLLNKVRMLDEAHLEGSKSSHSGERKFATADTGSIVKTLLDEHQARRGEGVPLLRDSWTATLDSDGHAWSKKKTWYLGLGDDLLTTLQGQVDAGHCDWRTQGRGLRIYNPDTHWADRHEVVKLRVGKEILAAPVEESLEDVATHILVKGEKKVHATIQNEAGPRAWGFWESCLNEGGLDTISEAKDAGQKQLDASSRVRGQYTYSLALQDASLVPLVHYFPGDWVEATTPNGQETVRVQQITMSRGSDGLLKADVVLNDRFTDAAIKLANKVSSLSNATSTGGTGSAPSADNTDYRQPEAPVGFTATPELYLTPSKHWAVRIAFAWAPVATATDGTALEVGGYTVWGSQGLTAGQVAYTPAGVASVTVDGFLPSSVWTFTVNALGTTTTQPGAMSAPVAVTLPHDITPPTKPSRPALESAASVVTAGWDGKDYLGAAMAPDTVGARVLLDTVNPPTTVAGTLYEGGTWSGYADAGETVYVRLVAFDSGGLLSTPSDVASIRVASVLDDTDLADLLETKATIYVQDAAPVNPVPAGSWWYTVSTPKKLAYTALGTVAGAVAWAQHTFDGDQVLAVGTVVTSLLASEAITADKIGAGAVTADKIGANEVLARHIKAGEITADKIKAGVLSALIIAGDVMKTAETGRRVVIDSTGITLYDVDDTPITFLNTDGESFFTGTVTATNLTVSGTMELQKAGNQMSPGSSLVLGAGIQGPSSGPTVSNYWNQPVTLTPPPGILGGFQGVCRYGTGYLALWDESVHEVYGWVHYGRLIEYNAAGAILKNVRITGVSGETLQNYGFSGVTIFGGNAYTTVWTSPDGYIYDTEVAYFRVPWGATPDGKANGWFQVSGSSEGQRFTLDNDGVSLVLGYMSLNSSKEVFKTLNPANGGVGLDHANVAVTQAPDGGDALMLAACAGVFDIGGSTKYYAHVVSGINTVRFMSSGSKAIDANYEFPMASEAGVPQGIWWEAGSFWLADYNGKIWQYDGLNFAGTAQTKNHEFTFSYYNPATGTTPATYESKLSPKTLQALKRRARVKISAPWTPGTPTALVTQLRAYGAVAGGAQTLQGGTAVGVVNLTALAAGAAAPTATTFPASSPAVVTNTDGTLNITALGSIEGVLDQARVTKSAAGPTYASGTWVQVLFDAVNMQNGVTASTGANTFAITKTGFYDIDFYQRWQNYGTAYYRIGAIVIGNAAPPNGANLGAALPALSQRFSTDWYVDTLSARGVYLTAGQVVTFWIRSGVGSTWNTATDTLVNKPPFAYIRRVGA